MNMPLLDVSTYIPQLFWLVISFVLLYFLLSKICIPQLSNIALLREAKINDALAQAKIAQEEALKLKNEYEEKYIQAIATKNTILTEASANLIKVIEEKTAENNIKFEKQQQEADKRLKIFEIKSSSTIDKMACNTTSIILKEFLGFEEKNEVVVETVQKIKEDNGVNYV